MSAFERILKAAAEKPPPSPAPIEASPAPPLVFAAPVEPSPAPLAPPRKPRKKLVVTARAQPLTAACEPSPVATKRVNRLALSSSEAKRRIVASSGFLNATTKLKSGCGKLKRK
jgi:hypothetical protein